MNFWQQKKIAQKYTFRLLEIYFIYYTQFIIKLRGLLIELCQKNGKNNLFREIK
jgi:hypothetical protein